MKNNLIQTWKVINKALNMTINITRLEMMSIINDNKIYTDVSQICELFNDKFSSLGSRVNETIPPPSSEDEMSS